MFKLPNQLNQLFEKDYLIDYEQKHRAMLQLRILQQKLKEEKLKDKLVYQLIKDKISAH